MKIINRRKTREIKIGTVHIGGSNPIAIQSMTNTKTENISKTVEQINSLEKAGCEIVRVTISNEESAKNIPEIKKQIKIPFIADIHYDYKLAIMSIENGADKIRINPGNIGSKDNLKKIVSVAKEKDIPIRIGVNSGSLEKDILEKYKRPSAEALAESAIRNIDFFEQELDYKNIVLSIKSKDVLENYEAYKLFTEKSNSDIPLHLGITESGLGESAIIKSSIGIGSLLLNGIGDTIRVSLTGNPVNEISVAKKILNSLSLRKNAINIISCPTCGRTTVDLEKIVLNIEKELSEFEENYKGKKMDIAIMGCPVNGPGEAKDADFGFAFAGKEAVFFEHGKKKDIIKEENVVSYLLKKLEVKNGI